MTTTKKKAPARKATTKKSAAAKADYAKRVKSANDYLKAPAKKQVAASAKKTTPKPRAATPFVLDTKRARGTKTAVSALALTHPESFIGVPKSAPSHKFGALCVDHGEMVTTLVRRETHKLAAHPEAWCTRCGAKKGKSTLVPAAKAKLAIKPGFKHP